MPDQKGILTRLLVRLTPHLEDDWRNRPGSFFRAAIKRLSAFNRDHVQIGEKVDQVPNALWRAADGATSIQHAQAQKAYAEAEEIKMSTELRRRVMEANVIKANAEAELARIAVYQARLELYKKYRDTGVSVTVDSEMNLTVVPGSVAPPLRLDAMLNESELKQIESRLVHIRCPKIGAFSIEDFEVTKIEWLVTIGSRVREGEHIGTIEIPSSPVTGYRILSHVAGVVAFTLTITEPSVMSMARIVATILPDS